MGPATEIIKQRYIHDEGGITEMTKNKKIMIFAAGLVLALGLLCSCGGSGTDETATTEAPAEKATVTAGEAAAQQAEATKPTKTGTEDGAIDAAKAKAFDEIKGFDGAWENLELEVDDPTTIIDFDYGGQHYTYTYDQDKKQIVN